MKVTAVEARTCVVPLDRDIAFATRAVRERHYTLVRVSTDTGAEGLGFCYGGTRGGALATLAVRELLSDCVVGRDPHLLESIWETMYREALLQGRRGAVIRAIGAIDQALWDAVSREAGLPLHRYLGGYREETVPAYASGGYYAEDKTPDDLAREVSGYIDLGFFFSTGNGVGFLPDFRNRLESRFPDRSWLFLGDPWTTAVNSRNEPADSDGSFALPFDNIDSGGRATFLVNEINRPASGM